jgi:hypothetical protein
MHKKRHEKTESVVSERLEHGEPKNTVVEKMLGKNPKTAERVLQSVKPTKR